MMIIHDLQQLASPLINPVLTIGNFDGVHKGHLALFDTVKAKAREIGGQSVVMTFDPPPLKIMRPGSGPPLITPLEQKLALIGRAGIDVIICLPFTREFAAIPAVDFVRDILVGRIGIREIVVGHDYTFGQGRQGDISLLHELGARLDFKVHVLEQVHVNGTAVSSTSIRNLVREGDLRGAKNLLGRDYQICGTVVRGKNRGGRLLGFPTANLDLVDELIPKTGVYAVTVLVDERVYEGVTNIGYNPTFHNAQFSVETHVLDFSEDLLGKTIRINFIERLRDERHFNTIGELSLQIGCDIRRARKLFEKKKAGRISVP